MLDQAKSDLDGGKYQSAVEKFSAVLSEDPSCAAALLGRGNALLGLGRFEPARDDFSALLKLNENDALAYALRGDCWRREGKCPAEAVKDYDKALAIVPHDGHARIGRAFACALQGNVELGVPDLACALADDSTLISEYLALFDETIAAVHPFPVDDEYDLRLLTERLRRERRNVKAYIERADRLLDSDSLTLNDLALGDCTAAIALAPQDTSLYRRRAEAWEHRAIARESKADDRRAADDWTVVWRHDRTDESEYRLASALYQSGQIEEALRHTDHLISNNPTIAKYWSLRGHVFQTEHRWDDAIEVMTKAIEIDGRSPKPGQSLAILYFSRGQIHSLKAEFTAAVTDFTEALNHKGDFSVPALVERARCYQKLGDLARAMADYDAITALYHDARRASPLISRGELRLEMGDTAGAIRDFEEALRLKPTAAEAHRDLSTAYRKLGDPAKADYHAGEAARPEKCQQDTVQGTPADRGKEAPRDQ